MFKNRLQNLHVVDQVSSSEITCPLHIGHMAPRCHVDQVLAVPPIRQDLLDGVQVVSHACNGDLNPNATEPLCTERNAWPPARI